MAASMFFFGVRDVQKNEFVDFDSRQNARNFFYITGEFQNFCVFKPGLACNVIVPTVLENGDRKNLILGFFRRVGGSENLQLSIGGGSLDECDFGYDQPIGELLRRKMAAEVAGHAGIITTIFNELTFDSEIHSNVKFSRHMNYATVIGVAPQMQIHDLRKLLFDAGERVREANQINPELGLKMFGIYAYDINEVRKKLSFVKQNCPGDTEGAHLPENVIALTNYASMAGLWDQECRPFAITQLHGMGLTGKLTDHYVDQIVSKKTFGPSQ